MDSVNYDELAHKLRYTSGFDYDEFECVCLGAAEAIVQLQARVAELVTERESATLGTLGMLIRALTQERDEARADLAAARTERDELKSEMEHLSDMVSEVQELERKSCAIIRSVSDDVPITTPTRDYSALSPLDCYEAGLLDGGAAVRAHINAVIAEQTK